MLDLDKREHVLAMHDQLKICLQYAYDKNDKKTLHSFLALLNACKSLDPEFTVNADLHNVNLGICLFQALVLEWMQMYRTNAFYASALPKIAFGLLVDAINNEFLNVFKDASDIVSTICLIKEYEYYSCGDVYCESGNVKMDCTHIYNAISHGLNEYAWHK